MSELLFYRHGTEVLRFKVEAPRVLIGRGAGCDVVIPDERVSRQQLALLVVDGKAYVEDLSGRGSTVGGQLVTRRVPLQDGADIALGEWNALWRQASGEQGEASESDGGQETVKRHVETMRAAPEPAVTTQGRGRVEASLKAHLLVRHGGRERVFELGAKSLTVGKDAGNDVVLDGDSFVSGKHLRISPNVPSPGLFRLSDLHSTNGSFVGLARIYEADVPVSTTIRVGETELVIEAADEKAAWFSHIVGDDPAIRQLLSAIGRIAPSQAPVTILGETGTGKELVARAIHQRSARADKPFIPVNCAAISKTLIESELFGHEKGGFTGAVTDRKGAFEEADGGTLFLDEIGELSPELQATLLRALESGEVKRVGAARPTHVDVRLVAATNVDLLRAVRERRFREDLYYRLCVVPVSVPPLRARPGDVPALAEHFLKAFSPRGGRIRFTDGAVKHLKAQLWPGNVRELRNVVHRGLLMRKSAQIDVADLVFDEPRVEPRSETGVEPKDGLSEGPGGVSGMGPGGGPFSLRQGKTLDETMREIEREIVEGVLIRYGNNRERAAKALGLARSAFFKRLKGWGLTSPDED